jgi:2-succinyl-6-hydroxy-2,4-cyclohexadiene-1-carboxylate synthase
MRIKNYQFNYNLVGDSDQPVLIFLHGFLGSVADWQPILVWFSDAYYCLAIDLPGHGRTRVEGDEYFYTLPPCTEGIIGLLDELGIGRAHLIGYSLGGRLALNLAVYYPERWYKLIMESSSPGLPDGQEKEERWRNDQKLATELEQENIQTFITAWYQQPVFRSLYDHPRFAELQRSRCQNDRFELARSLRGMSVGKQESLWNKLAEIPFPIMMLVGEYDPKYKKIGEEMKQRCPELDLKVVENCGHMIHFENPHLFACNVRLFLETAQHF